jgi:hypothetical protein
VLKSVEFLTWVDVPGGLAGGVSEFRSRKQPSIHGLLLQGPFSKHSFLTIMLLLVANLQLLVVPKLDTHVDASYVLYEFHESCFKDLVN